MTKKEKGLTNETAQFYFDAFPLMPDYLYILNKNCELINCNQNFLTLLGLDALGEQTVGQMYQLMQQQALWSKDQIQQIKQQDIEALLTGQPKLEVEAPSRFDKQGILNYQTSRMPLKNKGGEVYGVLVIFKDITEQKYQADQLHKITQELQSLNANSTIAPTLDPNRAHPPKVLLIEDNDIAQKAAQSVLMNCDCMVDVAKDEAQVHELFKPGKYDLIFMDIGLQDTSGYVMAKQLRNQEQTTPHKVPIIALTGYDAEVVSFDCDYYQMEGAITKPLTMEQVKQIIQRYLRHIDIHVTGLKQVTH